jgi:phage tail sheath protein FI
MPPLTTYPGVYIEEIPSGVRTITGVATSITAFLGRAILGPTNEPTTINSFADFERQFGGIGADYPMSYAVRDFYLNGGSQALIVRLEKNSSTAKQGDIKLEAASPGSWGKKLVYVVDGKGITDEVATRFGINKSDLFNLTIYNDPGSGVVEKFLNVAVAGSAGSRRLDRVLTTESSLVRVQLKNDGTPDLPGTRPTDSPADEDPSDPAADKSKFKFFTTDGADSDPLTNNADILGDEGNKTGMFSLAKADLFNLLCIPPDTRGGDTSAGVYQQAMIYCARRRAMLLVDSPIAWGANKETAAANAVAGLPGLGLTGVEARNAALYFPRVVESDPELDGQLDTFVPSGIVAGVMARTDTQRGVWKAPAGLDASVNGVAALQANLNDAENGMLNPLGVNCLRTFPSVGRVVWGSRTLRGADQLADEYKYVPVRRTALFLEESLYRGTQWVVFEPNDEPLWAQIRLNIGAFMQSLFRQGAFQGKTPREAYLVKCDSETTTQNDINRGIVNILVGFAPLKPAEFVIIKIQQLAGQIET